MFARAGPRPTSRLAQRTFQTGVPSGAWSYSQMALALASLVQPCEKLRGNRLSSYGSLVPWMAHGGWYDMIRAPYGPPGHIPLA